LTKPSDEALAEPARPAVEQLPPWKPWTIPSAIALGLVLGSIADLIVTSIAAATGASVHHLPPVWNIAADIFFDLGFVVAAIYLAAFNGGLRYSDFGFRRAPLVRSIGIMGLAGLCYFIATAAYASLLQLHGKEQLPSGLGSPSETGAMIAVGLFVCVIAPICEEFFFRGFLFGALRAWWSPKGAWGTWSAAVLVGLLFGAAHTGSAALKYLIPLAILGFVLCIVRWKTGSLYPGMAMHSINNTLAFGIDELHWNAAKMSALAALSLAAIALLVGPLGKDEPPVLPGP
jgi:membrane protease YdiL (CAAX protease family)